MLAPHEETAFGTSCGEWIERRLVRAFVKKFWQSLFFRTSDGDSIAIDDLCDIRILIVHVADENRLRRTNNDTRRFELHVDAMRAEVTFLSGVILRIDKDRVVRTRSHARLATDADRFIKIDNAIRAFEHRRRWTSGYARRVSALIAACYLVSASRLRKDADVDVFDVCARDGKRNEILRLACRRAGMTADAARVVNYLGPLNRVRLFHHRGSGWKARLYHIDKSHCGVTH